jgi:hypothetical protein
MPCAEHFDTATDPFGVLDCVDCQGVPPVPRTGSELLEAVLGVDPFASIPAGNAATCEVRPRTWGVAEKPCELVSKDAPRSKYDGGEPAPKKRKRVDLNRQQREWLEKHGYRYERVERPNAYGRVTVDMFGFADYIAFRKGEFLLVQTTTAAHAAERIRKIKRIEMAARWLECGGKIEVHSWSQPEGPGSKWQNTVRPITSEGE